MTWVEVVIIVCAAAIALSFRIRDTRARRGVRVAAALVVLVLSAIYGSEIVRDLIP